MKKQPKKPQRYKLGQEEIVTFSQTQELYDPKKFTPTKCLKPVRRK